MRELLLCGEVLLIFGGLAITMVGMIWCKAAPVLRFFSVEADDKRGFKVLLTGFAIFAAGLGLVFLSRRIA